MEMENDEGETSSPKQKSKKNKTVLHFSKGMTGK